MCPVLVTGLGGLYSSLPNSFDIGQSDWYRITPDDVADIPKLTLFMNCLEFCNAVVQVAHPLIKQQLLDFMYQGFIVPILGPALLQVIYTYTETSTTHTHTSILPIMAINALLQSFSTLENEIHSIWSKLLLKTKWFFGLKWKINFSREIMRNYTEPDGPPGVSQCARMLWMSFNDLFKYLLSLLIYYWVSLVYMLLCKIVGLQNWTRSRHCTMLDDGISTNSTDVFFHFNTICKFCVCTQFHAILIH